MEFVGRRVKALWPSIDGPPIWYEGCIKSFQKERGHHIIYDDGDEEWVEELDGENVILIGESVMSRSCDTWDNNGMEHQFMTTRSQEIILHPAAAEIFQPQQILPDIKVIDGLSSSGNPTSIVSGLQQTKSSPMKEIQNNNLTQLVYTKSRCEGDEYSAVAAAAADVGVAYSSVEGNPFTDGGESRPVDGYYCDHDNNDISSLREELEQSSPISTIPPLLPPHVSSFTQSSGCVVVLKSNELHNTATVVRTDKYPYQVESPAEYGPLSDVALLEVRAIEAENVDVLVGPQRECNTFVRISYVAASPSTPIDGNTKARKGGESNHNNTMLRCKAPIHVTDVAERQHNPKWKKSSFSFEVYHGGDLKVFQGHFVFALHASSQGGKGRQLVSGGSKPFLGQVLIPVYPLLLSLRCSKGEEESLSSNITGNFTLEDREGKPLDPVIRMKISCLMRISTVVDTVNNNALVRFCEDESIRKKIPCCKLPLDSSAVVVAKRSIKQAKNNHLARNKVVHRRQPTQRSSSTEECEKKSIPSKTKSHLRRATDTNTTCGTAMEIALKRIISPKCNNTAGSFPYVLDDGVLLQVHGLVLEVATIRKRVEKGRVQVSRMIRDISRCRRAIGVLCKSFPHLKEVEVSQMLHQHSSSEGSFKTSSFACKKALSQLENASGKGDDDLVNLEYLHEALIKPRTSHSMEQLKTLQDMTEADNMKAKELCKQVEIAVKKGKGDEEECQDGKQLMEAQVCHYGEVPHTRLL